MQRDLRYVADVCGERESRLDNGLVLMDCIVDWGVPGLGNHCPDISVFEKLKKRPPRSYGIFRVGTYGGRCVLGVEIVSPDTCKNDVKIKLIITTRPRWPSMSLSIRKNWAGHVNCWPFDASPRPMCNKNWTAAAESL